MTSPSALISNPSSALDPKPSPSTQLPGTASTSAPNQLDANSFITLLSTELQSQDPLNPMDPTQMVDQLAQINSLQQLIQIQSDLQTLNAAVVPGSQMTSDNGTGTNSGTTS